MGSATSLAVARAAFLVLILTQAAHSIEEYAFKLYDVFAPARLVSGLFSDNPRVGFAIGNVLLVAFGVWCYLARVRPARPSARAWMWAWVALEAANGTGHIFFATTRGEYFPGVITAPVLLIVSIYLGARLARSEADT